MLQNPDTLTRSATAFRSFADLLTSIEHNAYVPSLSRRNATQRELGVVLERQGHRVYWL
jgi:hypothetical protein